MTPRPDRPVGSPARVTRRFVRGFRTLRLRAKLGSRLELGRNVHFGRNATLLPPGRAVFGDNVGVGADFHLEVDLVTGSDVLISSRVAMVGKDHVLDDPETPVYWSGRRDSGAVVIEGDNLIGFGSIIVAPSRIGRGTIVGAGSVVVGDLPPNSICVGVPARPIKDRFQTSDAAVHR
jgi:acetyltransferase-like isoleucine patch superfamily enzyme